MLGKQKTEIAKRWIVDSDSSLLMTSKYIYAIGISQVKIAI